MTSPTRPFFGVVIGLLFASVLSAQEPPETKDASQKKSADIAETQKKHAADPVQSGIDRPSILVQADADVVITKILLRGLEGTPATGDLEAGLLTSNLQPNFLVRPKVTLLAQSKTDKPNEYIVTLQIEGLAVFGESSAPLLYKGRQVELLRFSKPGLVAKPPVGDAFIVREAKNKGADQAPSILLVLENPSTFGYKTVRARLRFDNRDVCLFTAEDFGDKHQNSKGDCNTSDAWTEFDIPQYAQVSLRAEPSTSWFYDPATDFAKSAKRKGWLTLRYKGEDPSRIQEQDVPIEIQFEPSSGSLFRSLFWVAAWLLGGAALSLFLRVTVPNLKRKNQLKDQLSDAGKAISTISAEVDSNLRVLLRVERRSLDELRVAVWPFGPGYADYASRVEEGIPALNRRIAAVARLDAALIRKKTLTEQSAAPTKLEQIEEMLAAASETLKQDQFSEEDWVFVNQRLENAQKLLREPTQTEKEAFEAMLSGRWKAIRAHFVDASGNLIPPANLKGMENCFPDKSLLPGGEDKDFSQWLDSVGVVRADLQLSALALLRDFQFLVPSSTSGQLPERWEKAKSDLNALLSTPAIDNLREAKRMLRQLAEGVSEDDLITALKNGGASLVMDPSIPRPDRTTRFSVRFRQANYNTAAARQVISCHWTFDDFFVPRIPWLRRSLADRMQKQPKEGTKSKQSDDLLLPEDGWYVHHYFEKQVYESVVTVNFYNSRGQAIEFAPSENWPQMRVKPRPDRRPKENWQRFGLEIMQVGAALLVPLATLASTTVNGGTASHWWEIVAIGFGSDTIKNIIVGKEESRNTAQNTVK
jgi:hypothetical protein